MVTLSIATKSGTYTQTVDFIPKGETVEVITTTRDEYAGGLPPYTRETMPVEKAREKYHWLVSCRYSRIR